MKSRVVFAEVEGSRSICADHYEAVEKISLSGLPRGMSVRYDLITYCDGSVEAEGEIRIDGKERPFAFSDEATVERFALELANGKK